jgi:excinuclease ABC subunit A
MERRYRETNSEYIREKISEFMSDRPCPSCGGKRLNPAALAVTVDDVNIVEANSWPVLQTLEWARRSQAKILHSLQNRRPLQSESSKRSRTLELPRQCRFGLPDLNRSAVTLSGGEAQRIRLATQVGSRLVGVLYVLDEPSIGSIRAITRDCWKHSKVCATSATPFGR